MGAVAHAAATRVYGLFQPTRPDYDGMALSQLPPPFDNDEISTEGEVKDILKATVPYWRRLYLLQSQNVPVTEFTMWETVSNAVVRSQSMLAIDTAPFESGLTLLFGVRALFVVVARVGGDGRTCGAKLVARTRPSHRTATQ